MTILKNHMTIENEEFALISSEFDGLKCYGTIPISELDENGETKKELNGFDICISFLSAEEAIEKRKKQLKMKNYNNRTGVK